MYSFNIIYYPGRIIIIIGPIWRLKRWNDNFLEATQTGWVKRYKSNNIFTKPNNKLERESKMVSEMIRNRLLPLILDKLLDLEPGYTGSRISYRDSLRDSLDIDNLPEDYLNRSQEKFIEMIILPVFLPI